MEALIEKRARLRHELQEAYEIWMSASEREARLLIADGRVDVTGAPDAAKLQWFEYLAAKQRLVLAYADVSLAA